MQAHVIKISSQFRTKTFGHLFQTHNVFIFKHTFRNNAVSFRPLSYHWIQQNRSFRQKKRKFESRCRTSVQGYLKYNKTSS